jgi:LuxR family transcriptional regulator, maltose regulon positive regulatory protein
VIDDLHELDAPEAFVCLERFLERVPDSLRVVLATREEPRLRLHRLRLAGALTEIRGSDLRFSVEEARELLDEDGITLSDRALTSLHGRTEGWAAGLRLAALALADHPDPERFVSEFSGSDRRVAEYLCAEVLGRQPPEVRDLLLRTSVLDRVSGPLADVLTGGSGSERILQCLDDTNAFVTALDVGRSWFRYHHLFADLLRLELRRTAPTMIPALHHTAARWYEEHQCVVDAIRHAQAGRDWLQARRMLAEHDLDLILDGRAETVRALLAAFPSGVQAGDPETAIMFAGAAMSDGLLEETGVYLRHAQALADAVPEGRRRRFDLLLACRRLWLASWRGDLDAAQDAAQAAQAALDEPTPDDLALDNDIRASAMMHLGIAELWTWQLDDARGHLERALALARRIGRPYLQVACLAHLGLASVLNGTRLSVMVELADEAVAIGEAHGWSEHPVLSGPLAARGVASVWLGRFEEADQSLERAARNMRYDREPGLAFLMHLGRGLLHLARGRLENALEAFTAAEAARSQLALGHDLGVELQSRLLQTHVALGDIAAARATLTGLDPLMRDRMMFRVSEARICLAEGRPQDAVEVLSRALRHPDEPSRVPWPPIEAAVCDAVAREQLGDLRAAHDALDRALELAGPQRIILPFVLPPARELVKAHARRRTALPALVASILEVLDRGSPASGQAAPVVDNLSPAELRVLRYLPGDLKADEIAGELFLSPNTVRTHVRHIYGKLDAHSRRQAVSRARELGLLMRP